MWSLTCSRAPALSLLKSIVNSFVWDRVFISYQEVIKEEITTTRFKLIGIRTPHLIYILPRVYYTLCNSSCSVFISTSSVWYLNSYFRGKHRVCINSTLITFSFILDEWALFQQRERLPRSFIAAKTCCSLFSPTNINTPKLISAISTKVLPESGPLLWPRTFMTQSIVLWVQACIVHLSCGCFHRSHSTWTNLKHDSSSSSFISSRSPTWPSTTFFYHSTRV